MQDISKRFVRRTSLLAAALVSPALWAASPITPQFDVQSVNFNFPVDSARGADGSYVLTWCDQPRDGSARPVPYARIYRRDGSAVGPAFQVVAPGNTEIDETSVAVAADGSFVITWPALVLSEFALHYRAQRYSPAGQALGATIEVSTADTQEFSNDKPGIAMDRDGNFVIAWESSFIRGTFPIGYGPATAFDSTHARRYAADGTPRGAEIIVNRELPRQNAFATIPAHVAVAMDGDGDFVVLRSSNHKFDQALFAHRFRADGSKIGSPIRVTPTTMDTFQSPSVTMADNQSFVAAWSTGRTPDTALYFRRFTSAGAPAGPSALLTTAVDASVPKISGDAAGNFVAVWNAPMLANGFQVITGQRYNAAGIASGAPLVFDHASNESQVAPIVASDILGNFGIAWFNRLIDGQQIDITIRSQLFVP